MCHRNVPRAILATSLLAGAASTALGDAVAEQAIVRLQPGVDIAALNADYGTTVLDAIPAHDTYLLHIPPGWDEDDFELLIEADPRIAEAEVNDEADAPGGQTQSFYFNVAVEGFSDQYTWSAIDLDPAAGLGTGAGVTVALLDTGLDPSHPVLTGVTVLAGYNFVNDTADTADVGDGADTDGDDLVDELVGHGTFAAGIIATMAPEASILPIKVLDGDGAGHAFRIAKGVYFAVDNGAKVINLSLGSLEENEITEDALEYARTAGVVVVAAVGNMNQHEPEVYPAALSNVLGVASTDDQDHKSAFSNYGGYVDLSAPGTGIVSAIPGGDFGEADGTSASTVLVAGAAALVMATNPALDPSKVEDVIMESADDLDEINPDYVGELGAGRLNVAAAVAAAGNLIELAGDFDGDGQVGVADLMRLLGAWGNADPVADLSGNGVVDVPDLFVLLGNWG